MIAFVLADLRDWRDRRMAKMIVKAALILGTGGMVGPLHPVPLALSYAAVFVISGWAEGQRYRSEKAMNQLLLVFPRRPLQLAIGKALSLFVIWMVLSLVFSPLLVASVIAWGTSLPFIAYSLLCSFVAFFIAGATGFTTCIIFHGLEPPFGTLILAAWTIPSFFVAGMRMTNPFLQILDMSRGGWSPLFFLGTGVEVAIVVLFFFLSIPAIARARSRHHE